MTLPEVTISVVITGIVIATMSMATTVILRQMDNTEGRTNNARSEQNVSLFMPSDLSSAEDVTTDPAAVPCGPSPACPAGANVGGSNALMLTWRGSTVVGGAAVDTVTKVSYRVIKVGEEYLLIRVECYTIETAAPSTSCETQTVLHDLEPPPGGTDWIPGVTAPTWIMTVSQAAAADDTSGPGDTVPVDPGLKNKNAQRVVVTINGGGDAAGAGGGRNQISLSAGGTNRELDLTTDDLIGAPTFTAARSRCGGNFGLVIDKSGSIGSTNMATVRTGVQNLIEAFRGTPVKIQAVAFSYYGTTLGADPSWTKYYDMLVDSDVDALKSQVAGLSSNGGTNWEDAFFRMIKNSDGTVQAQLPNTILFFTDGVPTFSRLEYHSGSAGVTADPLDTDLPNSDGSSFYQIGWNRTERLIRDRGSINIVGVYVNSNTNASSTWREMGAGYHWQYERGSGVVYQQGTTTYERGNTVKWQQGSTGYQYAADLDFQRNTDSDMKYQRWVSGSWSSTTWSTYAANNTTPDSSDGWRTNITGSLGNSWTGITAAQYLASNSNNGTSDGFRAVDGGGSQNPWTDVTEAQYNASNTNSWSSDGWRTTTNWTDISKSAYDAANTTSGESDGYRTTLSGSVSSWTSVPVSEYNASNTTSDSSDGWRTSTSWATTTQALYEAGNVNNGESDLWRTTVSGSNDSWTVVTQAQYDASNTSSSESDGWRVIKSYTEPYTYHEGTVSSSIKDYSTLGNLVVNDVSGDNPGSYVIALRQNGSATPFDFGDDSGNYTNAAVADLFVLPDYNLFSDALASVALDQCGGTVTLQTKLGSSSAQDPFTYENTTSHEVVTTSALYRSGTFDIALPGGSSTTVTISPQEFTNLAHYAPAGWSCKSAGQPYAFTESPVPDHAPWTQITLDVAPNKAISCVQQVTYTP
ncbi:MAG: VWA domain-containing protein [Ilumatobacteraceae bacterium]